MSSHRPHDRKPSAGVQASGPASCPDVTDSVLSRLGYTQAGSGRKRRELWLAVRRSGLALSMILIGMVCVRLHLHSADARRPVSVTVPDAVKSSVLEKRQSIEGFMQTIRELAPRRPASWDRSSTPAHPDLAIAPFSRV